MDSLDQSLAADRSLGPPLIDIQSHFDFLSASFVFFGKKEGAIDVATRPMAPPEEPLNEGKLELNPEGV